MQRTDDLPADHQSDQWPDRDPADDPESAPADRDAPVTAQPMSATTDDDVAVGRVPVEPGTVPADAGAPGFIDPAMGQDEPAERFPGAVDEGARHAQNLPDDGGADDPSVHNRGFADTGADDIANRRDTGTVADPLTGETLPAEEANTGRDADTDGQTGPRTGGSDVMVTEMDATGRAGSESVRTDPGATTPAAPTLVVDPSRRDLADAQVAPESPAGGGREAVSGSTTPQPSAPGDPGSAAGAEDAPLLGGLSDQFHARWREVQASFVDDPRQAVNSAGTLVDELVTALNSALDDQRREPSEGSGGDAETESLRRSLMRRRALCDRLLQV